MTKRRKKTSRYSTTYSTIKLVLFIAVFISLGMALKPFILKEDLGSNSSDNNEAIEHANRYEEFTFEVFDLIKSTYWEKISDEQISEIFNAGIKKLTENNELSEENSREIVGKNFSDALIVMNNEEKTKFSVDLANIILTNLQPFGRSGLYTQKDEKALRESVANIDKKVDLYKELNISKDSSQEDIKDAYSSKSEELKSIIGSDTSEEEKNRAKEKVALIDRAIETLGNEAKRENYKKTGIESTTKYEILSPEVFYIALNKISPTTFDEFQLAANEVNDNEELNTLILDLRGNVGGAIDLMQWFLGPFIGLDQYAYDFYHKEEKTPYKTKVGWLPSLVRYKKVVILIDEHTQSSAEIMAATLKKYNVGVLVGKTTRGWGTVENTFPIETSLEDGNKYSAFLVHSITLREDNQPIEGRGVDPHVNINSENWEGEFKVYVNDSNLLKNLKNLF